MKFVICYTADDYYATESYYCFEYDGTLEETKAKLTEAFKEVYEKLTLHCGSPLQLKFLKDQISPKKKGVSEEEYDIACVKYRHALQKFQTSLSHLPNSVVHCFGKKFLITRFLTKDFGLDIPKIITLDDWFTQYSNWNEL